MTPNDRCNGIHKAHTAHVGFKSDVLSGDDAYDQAAEGLNVIIVSACD